MESIVINEFDCFLTWWLAEQELENDSSNGEDVALLCDLVLLLIEVRCVEVLDLMLCLINLAVSLVGNIS